jgi:prepilin-type N-terminal cleavage/methylation domain-containing protein
MTDGKRISFMHTRIGFSLVELSIVLVILGLLAGGVLSGQSLIRAAGLRSVTTDFQRYSTAVMSFRDKYLAVPGDMANATAFWGAAATGADCYAGANSGKKTCNGTGDGKVITTAVGAAANFTEPFMAWQHLANAGLIEGSYTGVAGPSRVDHATKDNVPRGKISNSYWFIFNWNTTMNNDPGAFNGDYFDNLLQIGALSTGGTPATPVLKPEESWNIDTKIDDGKPAQGRYRERMWDTCTDAATAAATSVSYLLTETSATCVPILTL